MAVLLLAKETAGKDARRSTNIPFMLVDVLLNIFQVVDQTVPGTPCCKKSEFDLFGLTSKVPIFLQPPFHILDLFVLPYLTSRNLM